jgi:hypothetical protein
VVLIWKWFFRTLQDYGGIEKQMDRALTRVVREFESVTYMRLIKAYAVLWPDRRKLKWLCVRRYALLGQEKKISERLHQECINSGAHLLLCLVDFHPVSRCAVKATSMEIGLSQALAGIDSLEAAETMKGCVLAETDREIVSCKKKMKLDGRVCSR